jgi:hypothetical protein
MCDVKRVWQTHQAASWLACLGGDGFFDRRVVMHRSERYRHPEGRGGGLDFAVGNRKKPVSGLKMMAMRVTPGATSLSN